MRSSCDQRGKEQMLKMGGRRKEGRVISRARSWHPGSPESYTVSPSRLALPTFQGWCWDPKMLNVPDRCFAHTS